MRVPTYHKETMKPIIFLHCTYRHTKKVLIYFQISRMNNNKNMIQIAIKQMHGTLTHNWSGKWKWKTMWKNHNKCRQTKLWFAEPDRNLSRDIIQRSKANLSSSSLVTPTFWYINLSYTMMWIHLQALPGRWGNIMACHCWVSSTSAKKVGNFPPTIHF
jgi:hypothetical protein